MYVTPRFRVCVLSLTYPAVIPHWLTVKFRQADSWCSPRDLAHSQLKTIFSSILTSKRSIQPSKALPLSVFPCVFVLVCVALSVSPLLLCLCFFFYLCLFSLSSYLPQGDSYLDWGWFLPPSAPLSAHLSTKECTSLLRTIVLMNKMLIYLIFKYDVNNKSKNAMHTIQFFIKVCPAVLISLFEKCWHTVFEYRCTLCCIFIHVNQCQGRHSVTQCFLPNYL